MSILSTAQAQRGIRLLRGRLCSRLAAGLVAFALLGAAGTVAYGQSGPIVNDPLTDPSLSTSWPNVQMMPADLLPSGLVTSAYRADGFHIVIDHKSADTSAAPAPSSTSEYVLPNEHLDAVLQAAGAGADQRIEIDAKHVAGGPDNEYGIACRMTSAGGYVLFAGSGGRTGISKVRGIGKGPYIVDFPLLTRVHLSDDALANSYHLRADCNGSQLALFVNGQKIVEVRDEESQSGHVGVYAMTNEVTGIDVAFTNLSISPPSSARAPAPVPASAQVGAEPLAPLGSSERFTLNGFGSLSLGPFPLNGGNYSVTWTATDPGGESGGGPVVIDLNSMDGSSDAQSITNTVLASGETQSGATNLNNVAASQYSLSVSADGVWKVTVQANDPAPPLPPVAAPAPPPPLASAAPPPVLPDLVVTRMEVTGTSIAPVRPDQCRDGYNVVTISVANNGPPDAAAFKVQLRVDGGAKNFYEQDVAGLGTGKQLPVVLSYVKLTPGSHVLEVRFATPNVILPDGHPYTAFQKKTFSDTRTCI